MTSITDNSYIKNFKPNKHSHYKQGVIQASSCKKLFESCCSDNIIYRSGLEYKFICWCEKSDKVVKWASEPICIEYVSSLDKKTHRYYPDFVIETNDNKRYIVEIKPYAQTIKPDKQASLYDKRTWIKNNDKWKYAIKFAEKTNNTKFIIVTERFFGAKY